MAFKFQKKPLFLAIISIIFAFFVTFLFAANISKLTPVGTWETKDDHTGHVTSLVKLWVSNGELFGRVAKILPVDGNHPKDVCKYCKGALYNKPIQGMVIMWGMREQRNGQWGGGKILDPKVGKTYRCKIMVVEEGDVLRVRGFIGLSLLGRTQTWHRVS